MCLRSFGNPLVWARVNYRYNPSQTSSITCDSSGQFLFYTDADPCDCSVYGYLKASKQLSPIDLEMGQTTDIGIITMWDCHIFGTVYTYNPDNPWSSIPLSGATVLLVENGTSVVTGENGYFDFWCDAGDYNLQYSAPNKVTRTQAFSASAGSDYYYGTQLYSYAVTGKVLDRFGNPLVWARVNYRYNPSQTSSITCDSSGQFLFYTDADPCDCSVYGYLKASKQLSPIDLEMGQTTDIGIITMWDCHIFGTVYTYNPDNPWSSIPLSGATVLLVENGTSVVTGENGYFDFWCDAGDYNLQYSAPNKVTRTQAFSASAGSDYYYGIMLNSFALTGTVVDSDGNPLAGAYVYYYQYTNGYGITARPTPTPTVGSPITPRRTRVASLRRRQTRPKGPTRSLW